MQDIITVPIKQVHPYPNNPRVNGDAVDKVAASLRAFGFRQPIVVDKDNVVVIGHGRLLAENCFFEYEKRGTLCTMFINMY